MVVEWRAWVVALVLELLLVRIGWWERTGRTVGAGGLVSVVALSLAPDVAG